MISMYTELLIRFFSQITWRRTPVPVVNASPDRAYGAMELWLQQHKKIKANSSRGHMALPKPFVAVWNNVFKETGELRNPSHYVFKDLETGFATIMKKPKPVKSAVDVNFYLEDITQRNFFEYQIQTLFPDGNLAYVPVDYTSDEWYRPPNEDFTFAKLLGRQNLLLRMDNLADNSALEDSGLSGRTVRMTFTGTLSGWIPFQPYKVPLVYSTALVVCDEDGNELVSVTRDLEELN